MIREISTMIFIHVHLLPGEDDEDDEDDEGGEEHSGDSLLTFD